MGEGDTEGEYCTYIDILSYEVCNCMTGHTFSSFFVTAGLELLDHRNRGERATSLVKF